VDTCSHTSPHVTEVTDCPKKKSAAIGRLHSRVVRPTRGALEGWEWPEAESTAATGEGFHRHLPEMRTLSRQHFEASERGVGQAPTAGHQSSLSARAYPVHCIVRRDGQSESMRLTAFHDHRGPRDDCLVGLGRTPR
jgi:hypothetical protein